MRIERERDRGPEEDRVADLDRDRMMNLEGERERQRGPERD
jgi:hypothetical protein